MLDLDVHVNWRRDQPGFRRRSARVSKSKPGTVTAAREGNPGQAARSLIAPPCVHAAATASRA